MGRWMDEFEASLLLSVSVNTYHAMPHCINMTLLLFTPMYEYEKLRSSRCLGKRH
jgi:hypothetical protein